MERSTRLFCRTAGALVTAGTLYLGVLASMNPTEVIAQSQEIPNAEPATSPLFDPKAPFLHDVKQLTTNQRPIVRPAFRPMPVTEPQKSECDGFVPASFYDLDGQPTATGELMNSNAGTAAIPLPQYRRFGEQLGDYVRITVPESGASEVVRINDTGLMASPGYPDTYLDVTKGTAMRMGWEQDGIVTVCLKVLK